MYSQWIDNLNLAFLAPIGAGLLCNLYNQIDRGFRYMLDEHMIPEEQQEKYFIFLRDIDQQYNSVLAAIVSLVVSLCSNTYNYLVKTDSWLGINGGVTGLYGRIFVVINYFFICLTLYKFIVTLRAVRRLFREFEVQILPMHPDRAGGLQPVGSIAIAVTSLVGLVMAFFAVLLVFDKFTLEHTLYRFLFLTFYAASPYFFFATLASANQAMRKVKEEALERLRLTFDLYYEKLKTGSRCDPYELEATEDIAKVHSLYQIVESMPVWPFDTRSLLRFFSVFATPALLYAVDFIMKNFEKVKELLAW